MKGQDVSFEWAKGMGALTGNSNDVGRSIAVDASGNVYTGGRISSLTSDLDPGLGVFSFNREGSTDGFVSKLDSSGAFVWAKQIGGTGGCFISSIKLDTFGNIYILGTFQDTVDFDPSSGFFNLVSTGGYHDMFISKLDANGNFIWTKQIDVSFGNIFNRAGAFTIDAVGNVYTTGNFKGTVDFDPNASVFNLTAAGGTLDDDAFVSKWDSSGLFVWAKRMGGSSGGSYPTAIAIDILGNVYSMGSFAGTADFDPGIGTFVLASPGNADIFVSKLDNSGNFVWAKQIEMNAANFSTNYYISVDLSENVYLTGSFTGTIDFDPGTGAVNLISVGTSDDVFICKLNASGTFAWVKKIGGFPDEKSNAITVDGFGNVYTTGLFGGTVDFDPGTGTLNLTSVGYYADIFISKLNTSGTLVWAKSVGGGGVNNSNSAEAFSISLDATGNIYSTGSYNTGPGQDPVDFDPNAGVFGLTTATSGPYIFALKLSQWGIIGSVYNDISPNCIQDANETSLPNRVLIINPGNIIVTTNNSGIWFVDSLPVGNYTITSDTSSNSWLQTCPVVHFTVTHPNSLTVV